MHSTLMRPSVSRRESGMLLQRQCACNQHAGGECDECKKKKLQRRAAQGSEPGSIPPIVHEVLRSSGQPLDATMRAFMEPRFGHDFSHVRVHTDAKAADSAKAVNALAYTVGKNVVFGNGQYALQTAAGQRLLAHELTHVVQQSSLSNLFPQALSLSSSESDQYEEEANRGAGELANGGSASVHLQPSAPIIQRKKPTGINLKEAKPFGHADLKSDELKQKWRTYIGSTTLMQVTPSDNYKGHCVKEYLTEVANTCPARFSELRTEGFCTESKCLDFDRYGEAGDPESGKMVKDGPDTFLDRHRTRHPQSLLEGSGKDECSVVCHQRYKFDRKDDLGSFFVIRNFRAGKYTPPGSKDALHITTGEVQKVPAGLESPSKEKFAKDIAPGLKKSGVLTEVPPVPKTGDKK